MGSQQSKECLQWQPANCWLYMVHDLPLAYNASYKSPMSPDSYWTVALVCYQNIYNKTVTQSVITCLSACLYLDSTYKNSEEPRHKSNWALKDSRMNVKEMGVEDIIWITKDKKQTKKRDNDTGNVLNAHVVTTDLMGNRRVEEHVVERRPFVWPANFSLLAKGLTEPRQRESIVARRSKPSKTMWPSSNAQQCEDGCLGANSMPQEQQSTSWAREIYQGWAGNLSDLHR